MTNSETSKQISSAFVLVAAIFAAAAVSSCGVRGRPQPPISPPELGHGQPGFKRASDEFAFPNIATPTPAMVPRTHEETR